ncbi:MAG TPA: hypothetical protein VKX17_18125 [Planctomycetota bacterium]|nr:hypothetical protein [Planctomycetota bacterium]
MATFAAAIVSGADVISPSNLFTIEQIGFSIHCDYGDIDTEYMYYGIYNSAGTCLWSCCTNADAPGTIDDTPYPNNADVFPSGVYRFTVMPYPWNNDTQPAADFLFTVVAAPPTLQYVTATGSFVQIGGADLIGGSSVTISGAFLSALGVLANGSGFDDSSFRYSLDGGEYVALSGSSYFDWGQFTLVLNNLTEGNHHLDFHVADVLGNVGTAGYDFVYDVTAPTLSMPSGTITVTDPLVNILGEHLGGHLGSEWDRLDADLGRRVVVPRVWLCMPRRFEGAYFRQHAAEYGRPVLFLDQRVRSRR